MRYLLGLPLLLYIILLTKHFVLVSTICGYQSCPPVKEGVTNVHLVCHSHDDVGWLKTVDQYYYGANKRIQMGAVQYILDSVVEELVKDPSRKFIQVEISFFWRWYNNQNENKKRIVHQLVQNGQLEFINGGWVMNDEAAAHYTAIIDQMSQGLRFLNTTFGECGNPKVAWQIDPFGHSREQASLFARMGFDGLFLGRIDYQDKLNRKLNKNMEFIWRGSPKNLGKESDLFTGVLYNNYNPPDGFCFDSICADDPIEDIPQFIEYNVPEKLHAFSEAVAAWSKPYTTNHILMTMGSDFQYQAARNWYDNLDKLIRLVNQNTSENGMNLIYSTPSCYLQELNKANMQMKEKTDDFFPYSSDPHAFWTGYFTSRPTFKYYARQANYFLQVCKQWTALSGENNQGKWIEEIFKLVDAVAISQHHDAITGTAKQHVTDDYSLRLHLGIKSCENVMKHILAKSLDENLKNDISYEPKSYNNEMDFDFCHNMNISTCPISETQEKFTVIVYNPLARPVESQIRVPVPSSSWFVRDSSGVVKVQAIPIPHEVKKIPGRISNANYDIVFPTGIIQPLSAVKFYVKKLNSNSIRQKTMDNSEIQPAIIRSPGLSNFFKRNTQNDFVLENSKGFSVTFDGTTGFVQWVKFGDSETKLQQNFFEYSGMSGDNHNFDSRASGAYIFRPNTTLNQQPIPIAPFVSYKLYKGKNVAEVHQVFNDWVSQVVRLYDDADYLEFEWLIGPIPVKDGVGKEIITKYSTDIESKGVFFTDSNGREMIKRRRNYRPTWKLKTYEPISQNYYPAPTRVMVTEGDDLSKNSKTLIVLTDRAEGATSMKDGEIELMLHRRLLDDDAFGVSEPLNEKAFGKGLVSRGKHRIMLAGGNSGLHNSIHRQRAQEFFYQPLPVFMKSPSVKPSKSSMSMHSMPVLEPVNLGKGFSGYLKNNVHLLSMEWISLDKILFRLEHIYEKMEDPELSKPVRVSPKSTLNFFDGYIEETTLGGDLKKQNSKRLSWNSKSNDDDLSRINNSSYTSGDYAILHPMEIRTYIFTFKKKT